MPFSNRAQRGFENKIVALIARDMHRKIQYVWWAQRRGYMRNTLDEAACDIWPGVAAGVEQVVATDPYYRSEYVFVSRSASGLAHLTLDDARLGQARIGVQLIGNDSNNTPPAHAIAARGLTANVRGYMLYGDYRTPNPPAEIVKAVERGDVDVALVWGPLAGYFAATSHVPLRIDPVIPADDSRWPMAFDIAMGVQRRRPQLPTLVNGILKRRRSEIAMILKHYHVPVQPIIRM